MFKKVFRQAFSLVMVCLLCVSMVTIGVSATPETQPFTTSPMIAAGGSHSLALRSDGTVWAWGEGLGSTPTPVDSLENIISISAGGLHSLALRVDGTVWAWGSNESGQLGDGTTNQHDTPIPINNLNNIIAVSAGGYHSLALCANGSVWSWGSNTHGQLGDGMTYGRSTPVQVHGGEAGGEYLQDITYISAGYEHSLALRENRTVLAWGAGGFGQLGNGQTGNHITPVQVIGGGGGGTFLHSITSVSAGEVLSFALRDDGTVLVWGWRVSEALSGIYIAPVRLRNEAGAFFQNVTSVSAGAVHALALRNDGTVWIWGMVRMGTPAGGFTVYESPRQVHGGDTSDTFLQNITSISAGEFYSIVMRTDGILLECGENRTSNLSSFRTSPIYVTSGTGVDELFNVNINPVAVNSGTGSGSLAAGTTVTITANTPPTGQRFVRWNISPAVTFTSGSATTATASFIMPAQAVTATAVFEDIPVTGVSIPGTATRTLTAGQTLQLQANVTPANVANRAVNWSSNNPQIATVNTPGLSTQSRPARQPSPQQRLTAVFRLRLKSR